MRGTSSRGTRCLRPTVPSNRHSSRQAVLVQVAQSARHAVTSGRSASVGGVEPIVASRHGAPGSPRSVPAARPRRRRPVLGRLRQRRLVDLLRARRRRRLRARADPARVRHLGADLRLHRRDLRRGDGDVPRGRRLRQLRPPRVQRARLVHRGLGADAQLHHHGRDLGLLRPPLPRGLLGAAADEPRRHHRRRSS